MKKLIALLLALAMVFALVACGAKTPEPAPAPEPEATPEPAPAPEPEPAPAPEPASNLVGVSMPTKDLQRWNQDGANMEKLLKEAGYEVDLQFAANDATQQVNQIQNMIANGAKVLVISAIDSDALGTVLAEAKEAGVAVIAYDRLIMGSDAVTYYATFDNYQVGVMQGAYIEKALDLQNAGDNKYNIELVTGDSGDNNIYFFFDGAMSILKPYIDAGTLVVQSGQTDIMDVATEAWDAANAQTRFENILSTFYADKPLHAIMANNDSTAQGAATALGTSYNNEIYPIITGQDCDIVSTKNMLDGKQAMSVFKDTRDLAAKAVDMCKAIIEGGEPEINDTETYNNGTGIIPSYLCSPKECTADNYKEILIDSGYYTEDQLA